MERSSSLPGQGQKMATKAGWTADEDARLFELVQEYGIKKWTFISRTYFRYSRTPLQLRCRYMDILRPGRSQSAWSSAEDAKLLSLYVSLGPKWKAISQQMEGRVENDAKNRFHKILRDGKRAMVDAQDQFDQDTWIKHYMATTGESLSEARVQAVRTTSAVSSSKTVPERTGSLQRVSVSALIN
eukprot:CAMPEP_0185847034 /NCGR_PEP_ID=MMETSP1354-20130828/2459_1 /TAXON_ID=708628 /ORGANISM="Erythrolobus madagascarensis, Strain CCMP3276" /LENGTH=184 /DNA_ID=CAMNT_0028547277 /DNA_START=186 /DNA_END=740 /DNA_ORIENTATION=-